MEHGLVNKPRNAAVEGDSAGFLFAFYSLCYLYEQVAYGHDRGLRRQALHSRCERWQFL
jgi:hypothetical protein